MTLSIIAAVSDNDVIGRGNRIPWRQSTDLKRLKSLTMGHHMLMGRKTFQSLERPLPGRTIIVVAHGVVIRVLLTTLLEGYGPEHFQAIGIPNVGLNDLRHEGSRWRAEALAAPG